LSTISAAGTLGGVAVDGATSDWLKSALETSLQRDPVDALNDALLLATLLDERLRLLFDLSRLVEMPSGEA
jgi:hypothetical protein